MCQVKCKIKNPQKTKNDLHFTVVSVDAFVQSWLVEFFVVFLSLPFAVVPDDASHFGDAEQFDLTNLEECVLNQLAPPTFPENQRQSKLQQ